MKQKSTNRQIPWPNIRTEVDANNKQAVPLHKDYAMNDMWYLDTDEAYPMFEKQARIIKDRKYKGIIDVGCNSGGSSFLIPRGKIIKILTIKT